MNIFNRIKMKTSTQSKIVIEEKTYKDGQLYIKRETKTGEEAEKEIEKHSESLTKKISEFLDKFWE